MASVGDVCALYIYCEAEVTVKGTEDVKSGYRLKKIYIWRGAEKSMQHV